MVGFYLRFASSRFSQARSRSHRSGQSIGLADWQHAGLHLARLRAVSRCGSEVRIHALVLLHTPRSRCPACTCSLADSVPLSARDLALHAPTNAGVPPIARLRWSRRQDDECCGREALA